MSIISSLLLVLSAAVAVTSSPTGSPSMSAVSRSNLSTSAFSTGSTGQYTPNEGKNYCCSNEMVQQGNEPLLEQLVQAQCTPITGIGATLSDNCSNDETEVDCGAGQLACVPVIIT